MGSSSSLVTIGPSCTGAACSTTCDAGGGGKGNGLATAASANGIKRGHDDDRLIGPHELLPVPLVALAI